jgi:hypothetical protein
MRLINDAPGTHDGKNLTKVQINAQYYCGCRMRAYILDARLTSLDCYHHESFDQLVLLG